MIDKFKSNLNNDKKIAAVLTILFIFNILLFIHLFGYYMIREGVKPVYYIANVPLYVLVVLALAIPTGYALSLLDKKVRNLLRP